MLEGSSCKYLHTVVSGWIFINLKTQTAYSCKILVNIYNAKKILQIKRSQSENKDCCLLICGTIGYGRSVTFLSICITSQQIAISTAAAIRTYNITS